MDWIDHLGVLIIEQVGDVDGFLVREHAPVNSDPFAFADCLVHELVRNASQPKGYAYHEECNPVRIIVALARPNKLPVVVHLFLRLHEISRICDEISG